MHNFIWQESWQVHFGRDYDGKVTPDEVAAAALYLKDTLGQEPVQDLVSNLAKDKGIFLVKTKPRGYAIYKDVYIDDIVWISCGDSVYIVKKAPSFLLDDDLHKNAV